MTTSSDQIEVAAGNEEQYAAWNGDEGEQWAAHPQFYDASVRNLQQPLMEAAGIGPDNSVLDVGCGNGQCTREAAHSAVDGTTLGIDLSQSMIRVAEAVAHREGLANAGFVVGDAQIYPFPPAAFDVALSRTSAMFFADQVAAFSNIARALRPGGRLAVVSWRSAAENEWISALTRALLPGGSPPVPAEDAPTPFRHADPDHTAAILTAAGFEAVDLEPLDVPMYFGRDAEEGFPILRDLLGWMVRDLAPAAADRALDRMRVLLGEHETVDGVAFGCAAWLITAHRAPTSPGGGRA